MKGKIKARFNMETQKVPAKCYVYLKGFEPQLFKNSAHLSLVNKVRFTSRKELRKTHYFYVFFYKCGSLFFLYFFV